MLFFHTTINIVDACTKLRCSRLHRKSQNLCTFKIALVVQYSNHLFYADYETKVKLIHFKIPF